MKVTKFRVPAEPPKGSAREAEYRRMDRKLSEEMAKKASTPALQKDAFVPIFPTDVLAIYRRCLD